MDDCIELGKFLKKTKPRTDIVLGTNFDFSKNDKSVILAYTNNRCNVINSVVRSILFTPEQLSQKYVPGEHIIFNNFYQTKIFLSKY